MFPTVNTSGLVMAVWRSQDIWQSLQLIITTPLKLANQSKYSNFQWSKILSLTFILFGSFKCCWQWFTVLSCLRKTLQSRVRLSPSPRTTRVLLSSSKSAEKTPCFVLPSTVSSHVSELVLIELFPAIRDIYMMFQISQVDDDTELYFPNCLFAPPPQQSEI